MMPRYRVTVDVEMYTESDHPEDEVLSELEGAGDLWTWTISDINYVGPR